MDKQKSKSDISGIKLSTVSHDTCFIRDQFKHPRQIRSLRVANLIQVRIMNLAPAVDSAGELFIPQTTIIFFNN